MKYLFILILYLPIVTLQGAYDNPYKGSPDRIKKSDFKSGLEYFEAATIEEQLKFIQEEKYELNSAVLQELTNNLDDEIKKDYIISLLKTYDNPKDRQDLVNATLKSLSYKILLDNLSDDKFNQIGTKANPLFFSALPIIDFFNSVNLPSFFQPIFKNSLINRGRYNSFKSFDQLEAWVEPYSFKVSLNCKSNTSISEKMNPQRFKLRTTGFSIGSNHSVIPTINLGFGLAYSHSSIEWKSEIQGSLHTCYIGPTLSCIFPYGHLSALILGSGNFYHIERETFLFPDDIPQSKISTASLISWDITARIEGGFSFPIKNNFYLHPIARIDHVNTFNPKSLETLDKNVKLTIDSMYESFFRSKLTLKATHETFIEGFGFIIPHLSIGWMNCLPLKKQSSYCYKIHGCEKKFTERTTLDTWSQYSFEAGISLLHVRGVFLSIGYEFYKGSTPLHLGSMRIGWSW